MRCINVSKRANCKVAVKNNVQNGPTNKATAYSNKSALAIHLSTNPTCLSSTGSLLVKSGSPSVLNQSLCFQRGGVNKKKIKNEKEKDFICHGCSQSGICQYKRIEMKSFLDFA